MSGPFITAQRLAFIVACFVSVTVTKCAGRPLEDEELSTVILRLLETSPKIPSPAHHQRPPQLSPAHRTGNMFTLFRRPPPPVQNYKYKDSIGGRNKIHEESSERSSGTHFDQNVEQLYQRQFTFNSVLHKNPAGPNPIGNEYRPGNTIHNVKKYRSPPRG